MIRTEVGSKRSGRSRTYPEGGRRFDPPQSGRSPVWVLDAGKLIASLSGLGVGIALIVWGVLSEFPTGPKSGTGFSGKVTPILWKKTTLRVGTFNIHGGFGRDRKYDLSRTTTALRGLDLIGLNEVHRRPFAAFNQAELLADQLETNWLFAPTEYCWRGEHFGSGALSNLQVDSWQRIPLERRGSPAYRNLVLLSVPLGSGRLSAIVTHADRTVDRPHQLQAIFSLFNSLAEPALLMGDLNTHRADPLLTGYIDSGAWTDCVGEKCENDPFNRIDWILSRGIKPLAAGLIENGASDHPCVWAELDLTPYSRPSK